MNRFGVVAYRADHMEEYYTAHVVGLQNRENVRDLEYPAVLFFRTKEEATRGAQDLANHHANVKFSVFEMTGGYESKPQAPIQFNISDKGILPV